LAKFKQIEFETALLPSWLSFVLGLFDDDIVFAQVNGKMRNELAVERTAIGKSVSLLSETLKQEITRGNSSYGSVLCFHSEGREKYGKIEHGNKLKL